jgi:hypothetical protein
VAKVKKKEAYDASRYKIEEIIETLSEGKNNDWGKFIVKAIIENADNTGNIIDKRIIDVKRSDSGEDLTVILDDGPQFDLFFTTTGDDVTISIFPFLQFTTTKVL